MGILKQKTSEVVEQATVDVKSTIKREISRVAPRVIWLTATVLAMAGCYRGMTYTAPHVCRCAMKRKGEGTWEF